MGLAFASWDLLPWFIQHCLLQRRILEIPPVWQSPSAQLWQCCITSRKTKGIQNSLRKSLYRTLQLDFSIFSPAGNPAPAFWGGRSRHSKFRVLVTKTCLQKHKKHLQGPFFGCLGWLAWATTLDSALLFCSVTLSMCTQWQNKVIFSHFIPLPGQLATAKRRSDKVTGVKLTKSSQQRPGSEKEEKVLLCVCTQQFRALVSCL